MKRVFVISTVVVFLSGLMLGVSATRVPAAEKPIELTITYHWPAGSNDDKHFNQWAKKIEKDSKGRLKFKFYAGGVLVGAFETYHSIPKGVADIGMGYRYGKGAPFTDELFATALMGTPDVATSTRVVDDLVKKYPEYYEKEWGDTKILWIQADLASYPITKPRPIRTPKDAEGLEMRAPIKPMAEAWKAMGAKPVAMPQSDFVIGLQKGTVDGGTTNPIHVRTFKLVNLTKYFTEFPIVCCPTFYIVMNKDKWNSLPPDLQKVIEDNCEWGKRETVKWLDEEAKVVKKWAQKQGYQYISLTPAERKQFLDVLTPVYLRLAKDLDDKGYPAAAAFKYAQERLAHHAKW